MNDALNQFIDHCRAAASTGGDAASCVDAILPLMRDLLTGPLDFITDEHRRSDPDHYARNAIYLSDDDAISLFSLVWRPGQWTPVHDHGTWGVVGIAEGLLEERAYQRTDEAGNAVAGLSLARGGSVLLPPGAVTSFVPNPDHIHKTGVADDQEPCLSLHLYGRVLSDFHVYDVDAGTRKLIQVAHFKS
ncbi:MAG: cysteine dioxygenase family protein [Rhodospirillales bacterium]